MSKEDATKADSELDGQEIEGRNLKVNLAEDKKNKPNNNYTKPNNNYNDTSSGYNSGSYNNANDNEASFDSFSDKPSRSKKNWGKGSY